MMQGVSKFEIKQKFHVNVFQAFVLDTAMIWLFFC